MRYLFQLLSHDLATILKQLIRIETAKVLTFQFQSPPPPQPRPFLSFFFFFKLPAPFFNQFFPLISLLIDRIFLKFQYQLYAPALVKMDVEL